MISRAAVCASHAASRSASPASPPLPWILRAADFGRRVIAAACWSISHRVRFDGGCPYLRSYAAAIFSTSGVSAAVREENRSMTCWDTPPTSHPFPSARGTMAYPRASSRPSISRSTCAAIDSRWLCNALVSSRRHLASPPSARCTRFAIAMCTCSCGSPSRLMWWVNIPATSPAPSRHSPVVELWCPVRV